MIRTHLVAAFLLVFCIKFSRGISCYNPMKPPFSSFNYTGFSHPGTVVHYSCFYGYALNGSSTRLCLENGTWTPEMPSCESMNLTCGLPPHGPHSSTNLVGSSFPPETIANYKCDFGFVLLGPTTRECQRDGRWSYPQPFCAAKLSMYKKIVGVSNNVDVDEKPSRQGSAIVDDRNAQCSTAYAANRQKSFWKLDLLENHRVDVIVLIFGDTTDVSVQLKYASKDSFFDSAINSSQYSLSTWSVQSGSRQFKAYEYILKGNFNLQFLTIETEPGKQTTLNFCELLILSKSEPSFGQCYSNRPGALPASEITTSFFNDTCYSFVHTQELTMATAMTQCKGLTNGSLVVDVNSDVQQMMRLSLEGVYSGRPIDKNFWIGGLTGGMPDAKGKFTWMWENGNSIKHFLWGRMQPSVEAPEPSHCLSLSGNIDWLWDDRSCSNRLFYVCQHGILNCGTPELAEHVIFAEQITNTYVGARINHSCVEGFELIGERYRDCLRSGAWSGMAPYCRKIDENSRSERQRGDKEIGVEVIIAIVCGAILGAFLLIAVIVFLVCRHDKSGSHSMKFSKQSESAETLDVEDKKGTNYSSTDERK